MNCCFVLIALAAFTAAGPVGSETFGAGPDLCVVQTPLVTRHLQAWREFREAVATRGCYAATKTAHEVHVIRLTSAGSAATLELDATGRPDGSRLILILDADTSVKWSVRAVGVQLTQNIQHSIIMTGDSTLDQTDVKATLAVRPKESRQALLRYAERRYKNVNSFTQIDAKGAVLRLRLNLAPLANSSVCDYESTSPSPVVDAWKNEVQPFEGCFHAEQAGVYPKDIHVIDLDNGQPDSKNDSVRIHLAAGGVDDQMSQPRDIALVLKSTHPVRWVVTSSPILTGPLLILAEHPVDTLAVSFRHKVDIRSDQAIPSAFPMLILSVTADLGPPISYVRTSSATNRVELVVGRKQQQPFRSKEKPLVNEAASHSSPSMELGVRSLDRSYQPTPNQRDKGVQRSAAWTLQQSVRVQCGSNHLTASLPRPMAEALGVTGLFLNDRGCSGRRNGTHWMVKTHVTSCGSTSRIDGKLTTYSNAVHIQLGPAAMTPHKDDEDFEGSGVDTFPSSARQVTIPIQCHAEPNFPTGFGDKADDDNVMDTVDLPVGQTELYHMEIHRNKEWTVPVVAGSKAEVVFDETLHVRTWIDGVSYIQIVTEKCWVSNSSDSESPARLILIRNTCPADLSVQVRQANKGEPSGGFSFHVSKDYADMGQLYIHCKLGLCTSDPNRVQGNLKMCVEPSQYCTGRHVLKPFLDESVSTAQQILVRGPFRMVTKASPMPNKISETTSSIPVPAADGLPSTQVIIVGVSTEVTVGIALASFVIGVGLTAALWCIHMRTDPYRRVLNRKSRSNNRCPGVKCSPMIRSGVDQQQQQVPLPPQQQQLIPAQQQDQPVLPAQQYTYDYDVSSSQSNSSREESTVAH